MCRIVNIYLDLLFNMILFFPKSSVCGLLYATRAVLKNLASMHILKFYNLLIIFKSEPTSTSKVMR